MTFRNGIWNTQYYEKVLATDPIAYWIQDEKQGLVSYDMVTARSNGASNGAYTGVTLGQPGLGDGRTSPFFDGANDFDNVLTASFNTAFNGPEGTAMIQGRVSGIGVWTDGIARAVMRIAIDGNNTIQLIKAAANNRLQWNRVSGGVNEQIILNGIAELDWFQMAITWSTIADEVRAYYAGAQSGLTQVGLGAWAGGALNIAVLGALSAVPANVWDGYLAHIPVWDRPLSPAEVAELAVV